MYFDILHDLFAPVLKLEDKYQDPTEAFGSFTGPQWQNKLIGPDPGAVGRRNRSQRAAGLTLLSNNSLDMSY